MASNIWEDVYEWWIGKDINSGCNFFLGSGLAFAPQFGHLVTLSVFDPISCRVQICVEFIVEFENFVDFFSNLPFPLPADPLSRDVIVDLIDWSCRWGEASQNRGHRQAYCSAPGWYVNVESHGDDDGGEPLIRPPELSDKPTNRHLVASRRNGRSSENLWFRFLFPLSLPCFNTCKEQVRRASPSSFFTGQKVMRPLCSEGTELLNCSSCLLQTTICVMTSVLFVQGNSNCSKAFYISRTTSTQSK
jgi:hypothetical protein